MTNNPSDAREAAVKRPWRLIRTGDDKTLTNYCWSIWDESGNALVLDMERKHQAPSREWVAQIDANLGLIVQTLNAVSSSTEDGGEREIRERHEHDEKFETWRHTTIERHLEAYTDRATLLSTTAALRRFVTSLESDLAFHRDLMKMTAGTLEDLLKQGGLLDERGLPTNYKADNEALRSRVGELETKNAELTVRTKDWIEASILGAEDCIALRTQNATLQSDLEQMRKALEELAAERMEEAAQAAETIGCLRRNAKRLQNALEPFAEMVDGYTNNGFSNPDMSDEEIVCSTGTLGKDYAFITVGHLRNAARALTHVPHTREG